MKLSCLPVSFFNDIIEGRMTIGEWARMGYEIGLDAIDLSILFLPDRNISNAAELRREIGSEGMTVAMVTSYPDFTHPDRSQRKKELELEIEVVEIAKELGAKYVRVTAGQAHPETDREVGIEWAVEGLINLVNATRNMGVILVYENHGKPGAWQYTDFSQPAEIFLEIARGIASADLKINFDTANATAFAQDPLNLLEQVIDRVETIHAADTGIRGGLQHVLLGTGLTPFEEIFSCLKRMGWDNWICMEEAAFQGREGVEKATNYIREAWAKV